MSPTIRCEYESGQRVNDEPIVYVFEDFLSGNEIQALITAAEENLKQALVSAEKAGVVSKGRTGRNCWVKHQQTPLIHQFASRISTLIGLPLDNAESFQLIHYGETQKYAPHYDSWDAKSDRGKRCMARGGQRLVTCLLYLNDVEDGGGTCFPKLDMEVRAVKGRMIVFHNCFAGTNVRHPASLHGGLPVLKGEKWACNLWFRERSLSALTEEAQPQAKKRAFSRVI